MGTACYVGGMPQLIEKAKQVLGVEPGQTTKDGAITLELCRCVGACSRRQSLWSTKKATAACARINFHSWSAQFRILKGKGPQETNGRNVQVPCIWKGTVENGKLRELALHLLDIAENSVSAKADTIWVTVEEDHSADRLRMQVKDNGVGMSAEMVARVADPFVTSRTTRKVGLGIPLLKAAAEACSGGLTIESEPGKGTCITVDFQHSHIDRMPLGNLASTILTLVVGSPEVRWIFQYTVDGRRFTFDNQPIKEILQDDLSLTDPCCPWIHPGTPGNRCGKP
jgi:anti-sigma regulatory factor (Ser/Thr protein kinase)